MTLNPNIKTAEDLAKVRLGMGRATQIGWCITPLTFLEKGYGLKLVRVDKLEPMESMRAVLDGAVDAIVIDDYFRNNLSINHEWTAQTGIKLET